ncbi:hypothetical protein DT065_18040 [Salicibibacter kimchii]|uniref:Uncharacterized protein n=1 Tax=Salicibibacter kimchii TaxID=2099786 RepID=A0A345C3A2_9BACI|nr:hypothetical protein DT065_18040 [Salicibibacter kimchii]
MKLYRNTDIEKLNAIRRKEQVFLQEIYQRLSEETMRKMDELFVSWSNMDDVEERSGRMTFRKLTLGRVKPPLGVCYSKFFKRN